MAGSGRRIVCLNQSINQSINQLVLTEDATQPLVQITGDLLDLNGRGFCFCEDLVSDELCQSAILVVYVCCQKETQNKSSELLSTPTLYVVVVSVKKIL